ncbi:MAG: hypothetical protein GX025_09305 [Clostridiales bacterium]|nr:hypothetical protein [Clostridiales bacterium]
MNNTIKPSRLAALISVMLILVVVYIVSLYKLQIVEGAAYFEQSQNSVISSSTVAAARGNILDRYGRVLVSNRTCSNLIFDTDELFAQEDPNSIILQLAEAVTDSGNAYTDSLPITKEPPFEYVANMSDLQRTRLNAYLAEYKLPEATTAVELMAVFRENFKIDNNYTSEEMRTIAGIRYEIKIRYIINTFDYIFAEDVSIDLITRLMEQDVPGFEVKPSYAREYNTNYAAHILGYISMMDEDDYKELRNEGYQFNALIGKEGAEKAFESYLHGKDGRAVVTSTSGGTVISTKYTVEPKPGNHTYLTIDQGLQEASEIAMASFIEKTNTKRAADEEQYKASGQLDKIEDQITGGGVVAINIKTGEPLVIASYPTYELDTFWENYTELSTDTSGPLFNRALQGTYAPGSTFKPVTALAVLDQNIVTINSTVKCEGIYEKYAAPEDGGYAPKCWIYPGKHGDENTTSAIEHSCNYYFYTVSEPLGIDRMSYYAGRFGLGESTGIEAEFNEETGVMANKEYMKEHNERDWYVGDTLSASIGQSDSHFTPLQIANYCAAIANNGLRYETSILKAVRSYDYSESVFQRKGIVADNMIMEQEYYDAVKLGMYNLVQRAQGNTKEVFSGYPVSVAAKTGTAQIGEGITNNAVFMCFAPYEDPEIAVAIVIEKGGAGAALAEIAKNVLDYYFGFKNSSADIESENSLLK